MNAGREAQLGHLFGLGGELPPWEGSEISLSALADFLANPAKTLLKGRLRIDLSSPDDPASDREPVIPRALDEWQLKDTLLKLHTTNGGSLAAHTSLQDRGVLPLGYAGKELAHVLSTAVDELLEVTGVLGAHMDEFASHPVAVDVHLEGRLYRLHGVIDGVRDTTLTTVQAGQVNAKHRLKLWLSLLALKASGHTVERGLVAGLKASYGRVRPVMVGMQSAHTQAEAQALLADLVQIWSEGTRRPIPLWMGASRALLSRPDRTAAIHEAEKSWWPTPRGREDLKDPNVMMLFGHANPFRPGPQLTEAFELAERVWGPIHAATVGNKELKGWEIHR